MTRWQTGRIGRRRIQAGVPLRITSPNPERAHGLIMRGVVTATYEVDSPNHPTLTLDPNITPVAIYCDVLIYSSMLNQRFQMLKQVLVSQDIGGIHRGRIWKPRAMTFDITTVDITDNPVELDKATNPAFLDGDHVLVGFIDDNLNTPVIIRGIPHPSNDVGNEEKELGQRMKLKLTDGDPDFQKHHGSYYGIDDNGDFLLDTTFANDGTLLVGGKEPAPIPDARGSQRYKLEQNSEHEITLWDMSSPLTPIEVAKLVFTKDSWELHYTLGDTIKLEGKDTLAILTLGDGAVKVAIADHLDTLYTAPVTGEKAAFDAHVHLPTGPGLITGTPITPVPSTSVTFPAWDPKINSDKLLVPDT